MKNNLETNKIDFVMIWVDGSDLKWRKEKAKYSPASNNDDRESRYRDWDNLHYWFRAVEKFAPWVNKVYFITCGHIPNWLNLNCAKLRFVKHSDYIPSEYLPTFSSHPIELNLHRIKGLSEHFVYFNDDMFLLRPISPDVFFKNNLPVHPPRLHAILPRNDGGVMPHIYVNMIEIINQHFNMNNVLKRDWKKWILPWKVGLKNSVGTLFNSRHEQFVGFGNEHLPVPFCKSTIEEVWEAEPVSLNKASMNKFRSTQDVSQYLFRYWQLASGNFIPINPINLGRRYTITSQCKEMCDDIRKQKHNMICLNDMDKIDTQEDFIFAKDEIKNAFEEILPDKSDFEI